MWLMLQQATPDDYVIASGETHSVREFVEAAFDYVGINIVWEGNNQEEVGKEADTGIIRVKVNPKYFRPTEVVSVLSLEYCYFIYIFFLWKCFRIYCKGIRRKPSKSSTGCRKLHFLNWLRI